MDFIFFLALFATLLFHHFVYELSRSFQLTHWGRVTHLCVSNQTIIGPDNGLSPGRRQAIIWTNYESLLIGPLGTNFSEILIQIHTFSFKKMHFKLSSGKWRPFCPGPNVLKSYILERVCQAVLPLCWYDCNSMQCCHGFTQLGKPGFPQTSLKNDSFHYISRQISMIILNVTKQKNPGPHVTHGLITYLMTFIVCF